METTQTEPGVPSRRKFPVWQALAGLMLSAGAFVFGGFMAVPAVLAVIPGLRRFWPLAAALFIGVVGVRGLALAGVNPALSFARERALAQMENALGSEVEYDAFEGDALFGELKFTGLRADVESAGGGVAIDELSLFVGYALMLRPEGYAVTGSGLKIRAEPGGGKLETFLNELDTPGDIDASVSIEGGHISLAGDATRAEITLDRVEGTVGPGGWEFRVGMAGADLTVKGRTHTLTVKGGLILSEDNGAFSVEADMMVSEPKLGRGIARGRLAPGGEGSIVFTLDWLELGALWARYRKVDQYFGTARGKVAVSGDLSRLSFDLNVHVSEYEYYHRTFMQLEESRKFRIPEGDITGRIEVIEGETFVLHDVAIEAPEVTLATDPKMAATGAGRVVLNGVFPALTGRMGATVTDGEINQAITWSPTTRAGLKDVSPNLILVGEQFPQLELEWAVSVSGLTLNCDPLTGELEGELTGTFKKERDRAVGELRVDGRLDLKDGRVEFLGMDGDVTGGIEFRPNAPSYHAAVRGHIDGRVGDTPLDVEITGSLLRPGFIFRGVTTKPESLGRKIVEHSDEPLSAADKADRREELVRLCGPGAATDGNPFTARRTGKVFFSFKP